MKALVISPGSDTMSTEDEAPASEKAKVSPKRSLVKTLREALAEGDDAAAERALMAFISRCSEDSEDEGDEGEGDDGGDW
jgi:hypothetical protein